jgi:hypothetical protein
VAPKIFFRNVKRIDLCTALVVQIEARGFDPGSVNPELLSQKISQRLFA